MSSSTGHGGGYRSGMEVMQAKEERERRRSVNSVMVSACASSSQGGADRASRASTSANGSVVSNDAGGMKFMVMGREFTCGGGTRRRSWSPRSKQTCIALLSMVLVAGIFALQLWSFYNASAELLAKGASDEGALLDFSFKMKEAQIYTAFENILLPGTIQNFLRKGYGPKSSQAGDTQDLMRLVASDLDMEYLTLVGLNKKIIINSSYRKNRTGHSFVQNTTMSEMVDRLSHDTSGDTFSATTIFPYLYWAVEDPPIYREKLSVLEPMFLDHPYDRHGPYLIRVLGKVIYDDDNTSALGYLIAGDAVNGKNPICTSVASTLKHGFSGVYHVHYDDMNLPPTQQRRWVKACSSLVVNDRRVRVYSAEFDPVHSEGLRLPIDIKDQVVTQAHEGIVYAIRSLPFNMRSMSSQADYMTFSPPAYDDQAKAVYIRGILIEDQGIFWRVVKGSMGFLVALLVIQSLLSYISIDSFIRPLEKAAAHLILKRKVDVPMLVSVELFARYWFCVVAGMVASVVLLILVLMVLERGMAFSILNKVKLAVNTMTLFWEDALAVESTMIHIAAALPCVRALLDQPTNATLRAQVSQILTPAVRRQEAEHAFILNASDHVVWTSNPGSMLLNMQLVGATGQILHDNAQVRSSAVTPNYFYYMDNAHYYPSKYFPTTPDSSITPANPARFAELSLNAWMVQPIAALSNTDGHTANGGLFLGHYREGKTRILEQATSTATGSGWAAIYIWDDVKEAFCIISSVYYHDDTGKMDVDVMASGMEEILTALRLTGKEAATYNAVINGKRNLAAVTSIPMPQQYTPQNGLLPLLQGSPPAPAYFAYAQPADAMAPLQHKQTLYVALAVACQLLVLLIMHYLTYQPYAQLMTALQVRGFIKPGDRPTFAKVMYYFLSRPYTWWKGLQDWWVKGSYKDLQVQPELLASTAEVLSSNNSERRRSSISERRSQFESSHHHGSITADD